MHEKMHEKMHERNVAKVTIGTDGTRVTEVTGVCNLLIPNHIMVEVKVRGNYRFVPLDEVVGAYHETKDPRDSQIIPSLECYECHEAGHVRVVGTSERKTAAHCDGCGAYLIYDAAAQQQSVVN